MDDEFDKLMALFSEEAEEKEKKLEQIFQKCTEFYEKYKDIFQKSENVLKTVKLSYLKGGTTILDYLEAEQNWFDLQNQYNEAFYNYKKAYLQILFVSNYIQNI